LIYIKRVNNIATQIPKFDIHCFDNPTTEHQLYFLGLLFADGCVNKEGYRVDLSLTTPYYHLLEDFRSFLKSKHRIYLHSKAKNKNCKDCYSLIVCSKYFNRRLRDLGCVVNKSYYLKYPKWLNDLTDDQFRHFLRGYNDGNGSWLFDKKNKRPIFNIASTKPFLLGIKGKLENLFNCHCSIIKNGQRKHNWDKWSGYCLIVNGPSAIDIGNWLYDGATIYGKNKKRKFDNL